VRIGPDHAFHLTYCTNIHPGEDWTSVASNLKQYLPALKARLAPDQPFGVGLRLSDQAARTLLAGDRLARFRRWLDGEGLYVFTLNGFPYGSFHGEAVKDRVYKPDWRTRERVEYTIRLARILATLVPDGMAGSISTSPLSYKPWLDTAGQTEAFRTGSQHLAEVAAALAQIEDETGRHLHVDLEPEPDCLIENTAESIAFFEEWLWPIGGAHLADALSMEADAARALLRRHVQLCYDTCHFAVEYETPADAFAQFDTAGISIGKIQLSAALRVPLPNGNRGAIAGRLKPFAEATYLHQVVEQRPDGTLHRYRDLPDALPHLDATPGTEWRIHYHVPLFTEAYDGLQSTRRAIPRTLDVLRDDPTVCTHLEVETYTWDVLPDALKTDLSTSIRRELDWVLSAMREAKSP
jgi:sugar phosphate isomerase/epimerase